MLLSMLLLLLVCSSQAIHYYGTVMTYYPREITTNGSLLVNVRYKLSFISCTDNDTWSCQGNCGNEAAGVELSLVDESVGEWCQREGIMTRQVSGNAPFELVLAGENWITGIINSIVSWRAVTDVELSFRSDSNQINTSPVTTIIPALRVPSNCPRNISLLAFDPDGDEVKCRYGITSDSECNPCTPPSVLNLSSSCTLSFSPTNSSNEGPYAVQLVMEDFPKQNVVMFQLNGFWVQKTTNEAISKIPVQFVLKVDAAVPSCTEGNYLPRFLPPTPDHGAQILTTVNQTVEINIRAEATQSMISGLLFSGPHNVVKSSQGFGNFTLTWTPSYFESGESHPVCFVVQSRLSLSVYQSDLRCIIVKVGNHSAPSRLSQTSAAPNLPPTTTAHLQTTTSAAQTTTTAVPTTSTQTVPPTTMTHSPTTTTAVLPTTTQTVPPTTHSPSTTRAAQTTTTTIGTTAVISSIVTPVMAPVTTQSPTTAAPTTTTQTVPPTTHSPTTTTTVSPTTTQTLPPTTHSPTTTVPPLTTQTLPPTTHSPTTTTTVSPTTTQTLPPTTHSPTTTTTVPPTTTQTLPPTTHSPTTTVSPTTTQTLTPTTHSPTTTTTVLPTTTQTLPPTTHSPTTTTTVSPTTTQTLPSTTHSPTTTTTVPPLTTQTLPPTTHSPTTTVSPTTTQTLPPTTHSPTTTTTVPPTTTQTLTPTTHSPTTTTTVPPTTTQTLPPTTHSPTTTTAAQTTTTTIGTTTVISSSSTPIMPTVTQSPTKTVPPTTSTQTGTSDPGPHYVIALNAKISTSLSLEGDYNKIQQLIRDELIKLGIPSSVILHILKKYTMEMTTAAS